MGTLIVEKIVTADGYITDSEGGKKFIGITVEDPAVDQELLGVVSGVQAIVLDEGTFAAFAGHYVDADPAEHPLAGPMNSLPKHVISDTIAAAPWGEGSANIERGDNVEAVRALKERYDGAIIIMGSPGLTDVLFRAGLVDTIRMRILPVVIGAGGRGFTPDAMPMSSLTLEKSVSYPNGVVTLQYTVNH